MITLYQHINKNARADFSEKIWEHRGIHVFRDNHEVENSCIFKAFSAQDAACDEHLLVKVLIFSSGPVCCRMPEPDKGRKLPGRRILHVK